MQMDLPSDYKSLYKLYQQAQSEILQLKEHLEHSTFLQMQLNQQLAQLQKMIFGSKHERFIPADVTAMEVYLLIRIRISAASRTTSLIYRTV